MAPPPKKKVKVLVTALTLGDGQVLPLGFKCLVRETAVAITNNTKKQLQELVAIQEIIANKNEATQAEVLDLRLSIVEKLAFFYV